jgi:hypothetical protein
MVVLVQVQDRVMDLSLVALIVWTRKVVQVKP